MSNPHYFCQFSAAAWRSISYWIFILSTFIVQVKWLLLLNLDTSSST